MGNSAIDYVGIVGVMGLLLVFLYLASIVFSEDFPIILKEIWAFITWKKRG